MVRSPRSRGKGGRRFPGREGGRRKRRPVGSWRHRCQHLVEDQSELSPPLVSLWYSGRWGEKLEHRAYVLDQEMAKAGVRWRLS
jgi:hypothetical protein